MSETLCVRDLAKSYGAHRAIDGVSFSVREGEIFGLLGCNGAGKTTTIECVLGLREADRGSVTICGINSHQNPRAARERVGAALQSAALQDQITPSEALDLFGSFYRRRAPTRLLLDRFGLADKGGARFETLSAGQKQRLALALAFVNQPELILLDEPTAGLDPGSRRELQGFIRELRADGQSVLLSTHDLAEAQSLCDQVAILHGGRIVAHGTPEELIGKLGAKSVIVARTRTVITASDLAQFSLFDVAELRTEEVRVCTDVTGPAIIELVHWLAAIGNELVDLRIEKGTLEETFLALSPASQ